MKRFLFILIACFTLPLAAQDNPRQAETFDLAGGKGFIYAAPKPGEGKPWLWYAPTLKGVSIVGRKMYFEAFT